MALTQCSSFGGAPSCMLCTGATTLSVKRVGRHYPKAKSKNKKNILFLMGTGLSITWPKKLVEISNRIFGRPFAADWSDVLPFSSQ
jgi:hypothetical protein